MVGTGCRGSGGRGRRRRVAERQRSGHERQAAPCSCPMVPCRLFDTRPGIDINVGPRSTALGPGEVYTQQVAGTNGRCVIPTEATAISMNVTAIGGTAGSFLTDLPGRRHQAASVEPQLDRGCRADAEQGRREAFGDRRDQPVQPGRNRRCPGRRGGLLRRSQPRRPLLHQGRDRRQRQRHLAHRGGRAVRDGLGAVHRPRRQRPTTAASPTPRRRASSARSRSVSRSALSWSRSTWSRWTPPARPRTRSR